MFASTTDKSCISASNAPIIPTNGAFVGTYPTNDPFVGTDL
jgi:hypothetical protein